MTRPPTEPEGVLADEHRRANEHLVLHALRTLEAMDELTEQVAGDEKRLADQARQHLADRRELQNANRLATVGSLVASVVHELGTPLAIIQVRAQMLAAGDVPVDELGVEARVILEQTERMGRMVREVLELARPQAASSSTQPLDLRDVVGHALSLLAPLARARHVKLHFAPSEPMRILGHESRLLQILNNLIINATHAMTSGGRIDLLLERRRAGVPGGPERQYIALDVTDEGSGMTAEVLENLFKPFFTTRGDAGGTGLGLAVSSRIAREHGGFIRATSEVGRGSCLTLFLPPLALPTDEPHPPSSTLSSVR